MSCIVLQTNSYILLISPFICSFFYLSNGKFCHRFLSSYKSQCFKILCTPSVRQSVMCKWKLRCLSSFCLLFSIFQFFLFSLLYKTYGHFFLSKISQQLLELGFWNSVKSLIGLVVLCYKQTATYCLLFQFFLLSLLYYTYGHFLSKFSQSKLLDIGLWKLWQFCLISESVTTSDGYRRGYVSFAHFLLYFFLSNGNFCHRFHSSYWSRCFNILCTPSGRQSVLCKWK